MKKTLVAILISCLAFSAAAQTFEKLYTEEVIGDRKHCQGATGIGNVIFQFYDGAPAIDIYDLSTGKALGSVALEGKKTYHCNNAVVSSTYYRQGDEFPLIYVSQENKVEHLILVFRITRDKNGTFAADVVQKIILPAPMEMGLYYPNVVMDIDAGELIITGFTWESWNKPTRGNSLQFVKFKTPSAASSQLRSPHSKRSEKTWVKGMFLPYFQSQDAYSSRSLSTSGSSIIDSGSTRISP